MADAAIIRATFANYRTVSGRKVLQLICEVPIEGQKEVFDALGYPVPDETLWIAIARLRETSAAVEDEPAEKPERPLSQIAGMLCNTVTFRRFLSERLRQPIAGVDEAAEHVRKICRVKSRAELETNDWAASTFIALRADYRNWMNCIDPPVADRAMEDA